MGKRSKAIISKQRGLARCKAAVCTEKERLERRSGMRECRGGECKVVKTRYTVVVEEEEEEDGGV